MGRYGADLTFLRPFSVFRVWNPIPAAGRETEHPFSVNHIAAWVEADVAIILLDNDDFWGTWGNPEFESDYEAHLGRVSGYGAPLSPLLDLWFASHRTVR